MPDRKALPAERAGWGAAAPSLFHPPGVAMPRLVAVAVISVAVGSLLAACSSPPPPAAAAPPKPVPIDGTYGGVMQLSRGDAMNCGDENPITLEVKDRSFTYQLNQPRAEWKPIIVFSATIWPDGSFNAQSGPDSMSGQVSGGTMQGVIIGDICGFNFNAARGGTW
jgi:hypothetical protein